jgi:catechol 2,3-dioxygenase-like lactoylglutathione lyase family enzyme
MLWVETGGLSRQEETMTSISGYIPATRRPGSLGVHSLDHFAITVPDLAEASRFYTKFGLDVREAGETLGLYTDGSAHRWGRLAEGKRKALHYLSFGAFEDDMPALRARLDAVGIARIDPPPGVESNGIWFRDCDGTPVEIKAAEKVSPNAKASFGDPSSPAGVRGAALRGSTGMVRPRRMAHALIFVRDIARTIAFYEQALGLRLSDRTEFVAFLHGVHGSDHHLIAFAKSAAPGFHHCSWDVGAIGQVGLGAMQMADCGFSAGWGLGRHVLGSNYFHYVRDPWGSFAEYAADIDYIGADQEWESQSHPPENSLYLWGPEPPADFVINHEAVAA